MSQAIPSTTSSAIATAQHLRHHLRTRAHQAQAQDRTWQGGIVALSAIGTFFALLPCLAQGSADLERWSQISRVVLALVGLGLLGLALLANRFSQSSTSLKAGLAATDRAIYLYQTLLQYRLDRDRWLRQELGRIQQQLQERLGSNGWMAAAPEDDLGAIAANLTAQEYVQQRLVTQLNQVTNQGSALTQQRDRSQWVMLLCIAGVVLLPIVAPNALVWGAIALGIEHCSAALAANFRAPVCDRNP